MGGRLGGGMGDGDGGGYGGLGGGGSGGGDDGGRLGLGGGESGGGGEAHAHKLGLLCALDEAVAKSDAFLAVIGERRGVTGWGGLTLVVGFWVCAVRLHLDHLRDEKASDLLAEWERTGERHMQWRDRCSARRRAHGERCHCHAADSTGGARAEVARCSNAVLASSQFTVAHARTIRLSPFENLNSTGHAGRHGVPSGQAGTYPLVGG
eukprot:3990500-Prymnesium_polylepis.2